MILTSSWQQFRSCKVEIFCDPQGPVCAKRFEDDREAHRAGAVAIAATHNSLKSQVPRNLKSPFSNIHAVTLKLCRRSSPT